MEKILFRHNLKSYLLISFFGITAGLLVAFFSRFPHDDLWGLSLFSSMTLGFWMFTCALIALFSSKNYVAGINVALYIFFMFYITGVLKRLIIVDHGYNTISYFYSGLLQELFYGLLPAIVGFALAFTLWYGRTNKPVFIALRFLPFVFILAEAVWTIVKVLTVRQGLFMAIIDLICATLFALIITKASKVNRNHTAA